MDITNDANIVTITTTADTNFLDEVSHPLSMKYFYAVTALDKGNNESLPTNEGTVAIAEIAEIAKRLSLPTRLAEQYPMSTSALLLPYQVNERVHVLLRILDGSGNVALTIVDGVREPGKYVTTLDGTKLRPGAYSVQLKAGGIALMRPIVVGER